MQRKDVFGGAGRLSCPGHPKFCRAGKANREGFSIKRRMMAAALACREGELVSLTLITDRLPKSLKKPSIILITILCIVFTAILFRYGMDKVITQMANGKRTFVLNWPEWIFWSFVPIGAGCMMLHFLEYCIDFCCRKEDE